MNSKPLGYVSSNISDADPITPNILLMGRRDASLPQVLFADSELLTHRKWRHSQILADRFWVSFIKDYLPSLQSRPKWKMDGPSISPSAVVMVIDPQLPRSSWSIGTVTKVQSVVSSLFLPFPMILLYEWDLSGQICCHIWGRLFKIPIGYSPATQTLLPLLLGDTPTSGSFLHLRISNQPHCVSLY
ncbi:hypothetical protein N1851_021886 [Merluccius polli]|uniref:DUF5641 domain-containing protein n=1 Tax=Merluccius polli TaxID=89951 RepID=A0AA47MJ63_MERPO|nr:hypothetical protein N1851_021886 [Merluccius polli]